MFGTFRAFHVIEYHIWTKIIVLCKAEAISALYEGIKIDIKPLFFHFHYSPISLYLCLLHGTHKIIPHRFLANKRSTCKLIHGIAIVPHNVADAVLDRSVWYSIWSGTRTREALKLHCRIDGIWISKVMPWLAHLQQPVRYLFICPYQLTLIAYITAKRKSYKLHVFREFNADS